MIAAAVLLPTSAGKGSILAGHGITLGTQYRLSKRREDRLKGGKQWERDDDLNAPTDFWDWWHKGGGKAGNIGQDATSEDVEEWEELGRPRGPQGNKPWKR